MANEKATAGKITVYGNGSVEGPKAYLASPAFSACMDKINNGQSAVVNYGMREGRDPLALVAVALQTDYSAWLGMETFGKALGGKNHGGTR